MMNRYNIILLTQGKFHCSNIAIGYMDVTREEGVMLSVDYRK